MPYTAAFVEGDRHADTINHDRAQRALALARGLFVLGFAVTWLLTDLDGMR